MLNPNDIHTTTNIQRCIFSTQSYTPPPPFPKLYFSPSRYRKVLYFLFFSLSSPFFSFDPILFFSLSSYFSKISTIISAWSPSPGGGIKWKIYIPANILWKGVVRAFVMKNVVYIYSIIKEKYILYKIMFKNMGNALGKFVSGSLFT